VNALWYNALCLMNEWSQILYQEGRINHSSPYYEEQSKQCKQNFNERFWYSAGSYLYDVIDGPNGDDLSLRPNQLLAFSLRYPVLNQEHRRSVLDLVTKQLLTPFGLRTLSPNDTNYHCHLQANTEEQQSALYQGSAWTWLLGPYVDALLCIEGLAPSTETSHDNITHLERVWHTGLRLLEPFHQHFNKGMLGMLGGVFDGDVPHASGYIAASAPGSGEILRIYNLLAHLGVRYQNHALSI
jgi:glycogen debranching enzyme